MATKKIKWFRGDGTLYHPETEFSMVTGTLAKTQRADVLEVASLGSTSVPTYTVFASQTISAQGNTNSSYLVVGGGNFGGTYNGMWLVECSGRGSVATMRVTELAHNASGTVGFGHYVSSGKAYFGITRSSYGAGIDIYHLNGALGELKLFQNNTTMPTGWTAVTPSVFARKGDIPDTSKFVTLDTDQTIDGQKKFTNTVQIDAPVGGTTMGFHVTVRNAGNTNYDFTHIRRSGSGFETYDLTFPIKGGTFALTSDIPDVSKFLPLTGGILTGDLKVGSATIQTNGYITGTWLQTTSTGTHLGSPATKVAVLDGSGWIYHRTPSELLGDMGGASTSYVDTKVANIVNSAPETLDTLNELAKALGNDPNFATTVATNIGGKVSKSGDTMTGALKFAQSACADADGPSYLLAMTSFSAGGEVKYTHVRNLTSKGNLQWTSATHTNATGYLFDGNYIPTINTLAYWNGAYSGTSSNLTYCAGGEILSKSGGTLTASAQLQRAGISKTWVKGREAAIIRTTSAGSTSSPIYAPIFSQKSASGSWEFGAYTSDTAHLSYIKDTDYNAGNNNQTADYQFAANKKGTVAVTSDITWENMGGKPTNLVTTDGNQQTISSIKTFTGDWTGIKNAYGTEATSMFAAHEFEAYQDHHATPDASNHLAHFGPDKISRWLNTSTGYEYAFPNQSGTLALKEEEGIVIRAKYICARKNNDGDVLQVKIEFVSGKELVQPTDRIVLAQLRRRCHKNRASKYRYRNDCSIALDAFPADGIFNFILPRGITRNNSYTDSRSSIIANKRIYISRNQSKKYNDNWVRISNAISFRPLHNDELNHTAFAIDGD